MKSNEVLKTAMSGPGIKAVAAELNLSTSLLYKWCEEAEIEASGTRNPLDRIIEICQITGDYNSIAWLCRQANGFYVANPEAPEEKDIDSSIFDNTQEMIREFSDLLTEVATALADDRGIDAREAERIRSAWEQLKTQAEGFAAACEQGLFDRS